MIKKILKKLYHHLELSQESLISVIVVLFFSSFKIRKYITNFSKIEKKKSCIILGNGPSLNNDIPKILKLSKDSDIFVVNNFVFSDLFEVIKPKYYIVIDPAYWRNNIPLEEILERNKLLDQLKTKTTWPMFFFISDVGYKSKVVNNSLFDNPNIKIIPINAIPVKGYKSISYYIYKLNLGMPTPQNVLIPSIFLAINMKYKIIKLFGTDHSWHRNIFVNDQNELIHVDSHFYDEKEPLGKPIYWDSTKDKIWNIESLFYKISIAFKMYYVLNDYAKSNNIKIFNMSSVSFIDAFDRK